MPIASADAGASPTARTFEPQARSSEVEADEERQRPTTRTRARTGRRGSARAPEGPPRPSTSTDPNWCFAGESARAELGSEVRRQAETAREDREREPRDDLVRAQRDREERVDRAPSPRRPAPDARTARTSTGALGAVDALRDPETDRRAEQHHPLDAEVEDTGALGEELAERREEERRAVQDRLREHDDEQAVVHLAALHGRLRSTVCARATPNPQPVAKQQLAAERAEEDDPLHHAHEPRREVGALKRVARVQSPPISTATRQTASGL